MDQTRCGFMPHYDSDYYRARAIEQRGRAHDAERADVAAIHRDLAQKFEGLADQHDSLGEQFDSLAAEASRLISERQGQPPPPATGDHDR
jgi:hypothetical protein